MKTLHEWQEVEIQDIARVDSGQGAPQGEDWYVGSEVFVKAGDLNSLTAGKYVGEHCKKVSDDAVAQYKLKKFPKNSIVFPKSGMSVKTDNIALLRYDSYIVNHLAVIQVNGDDEDVAKYLYYLLKETKISRLSLNESYPSIRLTDIKRYKVAIPPRHQLREIVSTLEKADQLKQWRDESDRLSDVYLNSVFHEMFGDTGRNERNWRISTIGDGLRSIRYGVSSPPSFAQEGRAFIRATNIKNGKIVENDMKYVSETEGGRIQKCRLKTDNIIIVRSGVNTGDCAVITDDYAGCYAGYDLILEVNQDRLNSYFLNHLLNLSAVRLWLKAISRRAGQSHLNSRQVSHFSIICPPISLQNSFASIVKQVQQMKDYQKESRDQIDNLSNALTQKAFRGELAC